jgi:hypothetical protein
MMQSAEEHQVIPKEDAAVMPVGEPRKRRRDRNLAAGRRQKPKKRIQASCESRRRLNIASKKMTRRVTVAWRKRNIFRRIVTQGNCGLRKRLVVTIKRTTRCAKMARGGKHGLQGQGKGDIAPLTQKQRKEEEGKGLWKGPECNSGIRDRRLREQRGSM